MLVKTIYTFASSPNIKSVLVVSLETKNIINFFDFELIYILDYSLWSTCIKKSLQISHTISRFDFR